MTTKNKIPLGSNITDKDKNKLINDTSVRLYRFKEAAKIIGVTNQTLRNWEKTEKLLPFRHKSWVRYTDEHLQPFQKHQQSLQRDNILQNPLDKPDLVSAAATRVSHQSFEASSIRSVVLTSTSYETEAIAPLKSQMKVMGALIQASAKKHHLLFLFMGVLIAFIMKILQMLTCKPEFIIAAYHLQEEYLAMQQEQWEFCSQGLPGTSDKGSCQNNQTPLKAMQQVQPNNEPGKEKCNEEEAVLFPETVENAEIVEITQTSEIGETAETTKIADNTHKSNSSPRSPTPYDNKTLGLTETVDPPSVEASVPQSAPASSNKQTKVPTLWQLAISRAQAVYLHLSRRSTDQRLDDEERQRVVNLIEKIITPYTQITSYLHTYDPGSLEYDLCYLLLFHHPCDFQIRGHRWSVRTLSMVCRVNLRTKSASKSQVGRFLKHIKWKNAIRPKMLSSDPNYGTIMRNIALTFAKLSEGDEVWFGDEFLYTSSKVAEHLKETHTLNGLNVVVPYSLHKPYYKTKAQIKMTGLLCGTSRELFLNEMQSASFDEYYQQLKDSLTEVLKSKAEAVEAAKVAMKGEVGQNSLSGKIILVIDNARNHNPKLLPTLLDKDFNGQVEVLFLPRYASNLNLIEHIWRILLDASERCGETQDELREYLDQAKSLYDKEKQVKTLKFSCEICGKKWEFTKENQLTNIESIEKHICFQIEGLNPYTVYVLMHSLEETRLNLV
jgi:hypothetical protein